MIQLQDFLIVCNDSKKLQLIQNLLTLQVTELFEKQLQTRSEGSEQMPSRPRSFAFSPHYYSPNIAQQMWDHGTSNRNFTGAIFCDLFDGYKLRDTDQIPNLCEEFSLRRPKCKVNFHFDPERSNVNHFRLNLSTAANLNLFPTIEPDKIVRDLMKQLCPVRKIVSPRHITEVIPDFATYAR